MAITAYAPVRPHAERREQSSVHAVEKISPHAGFDGEHTTRREPKSWICTAAAHPAPSPSGTEQSDPYWDAPRLTPAFVAQVMGQVYCPAAQIPSAGSAYRTAAPVRPVRLDREI